MPDRAKAQLLERDAELSAIDRLIDRTAQGEGAVVVIEGPAGIGKSALIEHTVESADRAAMDYRRARGSELESDYAYGIVRELFESLLAALPADEREHLFSGAARLARPIFPALADQDGAAGDDAFSVLHGLYWLVAGLTERRPLALAIDDAHWADLPSLRLLAYLANRAHELPLLIVIGLRPIEAGPRMRLLDEVAVNSITSNLYPGALGADSVSQLLSGAFGIEPDPGFAAACLEATQGNPFFLRELVTSISAEGIAPVAAEAPRALQIAPSVGRSVVRRLGHLSDDALAVARSIAVLGNAKDASVVAALSELEPAVMTTAADALVRAEILRPDGLEFTHPIVRSAIYSELPPGERPRSTTAPLACCLRAAQQTRMSPCTCWSRRRTRIPGRWRCCVGRRSTPAHGGRRISPRHTWSVPWPSRPPRANAGSCCTSWGCLRPSFVGPKALPDFGRAWRSLTTRSAGPR